jgi:uncharacterized membrane protein YjfL (UPF0719 family)
MIPLLLSLAQLVLAVLLSAITIFLAFSLFPWFTRDLDEWAELRRGNVAVGIVLGASLVSVAIVLRPALGVNPTDWDVGTALFFRLLLVQALQLVIGLLLAVLVIVVAVSFFALLTRGIDEIEELRKGNLAIGSLLAGTTLAVAIMTGQALSQIIHLTTSLLF